MIKKYMQFDYETFSKDNIEKSGAYEYSLHKSTEILCVCFRVSPTKAGLANAPTFKYIPGRFETNPHFSLFLSNLRNPDCHLIARNAIFEMLITKNVFGKKLMPSKPELQNIPISRWTCTAALSRSVGIPGSLEGSGLALGLTFQKDKKGHAHMLKVCRPRKPTKDNPATRLNGREDIDRLVAYCVRDVEADVEAYLKLPELHPMERKFWEQNIRMNLRGFAVDRPLVTGAISLIGKEASRLDIKVRKLSGGKLNSGRQRDALLKYLRTHGVKMPNLKAATVKETLAKGGVTGRAKELLEIRESISRSSTAKYAQFEMRSRFDGRARDNTIFYGAHTGREAGTGLQPQNLFKTILKQADVEAGLELIRNKDAHTIEALYEKPMDLYASALRSCIVAAKGKILEVGDFATIEVRVLFWLAGHQKGLDKLASGEDEYCNLASDICGIPSAKIRSGYKAGDKLMSFWRQLGKQAYLGSGFGIGVGGEKFKITCKQYGLDITLDLAKKAVRIYREKNPRIPAFWSNIEKAAVTAVQNPGKSYKVGYLIWRKEGAWLTCQLPIGRKLYYFKPEIRRMATLYGEKPTLTFIGVKNGKMFREKTWGGKLTENVVQSVARDCLKESLLKLEDTKTTLPVLEVHDEVVCENTEGDLAAGKDLAYFISTMSVVPTWAKGLPIKVEGWSERRYRK